VLAVGDPTGITAHDAGRVHNLRLRQWRRTPSCAGPTGQGGTGRHPGPPGG
jgi:hypothetical protein